LLHWQSFVLFGDSKSPLEIPFLNSPMTQFLSLRTTFGFGLNKFIFELARLSFDFDFDDQNLDRQSKIIIIIKPGETNW
jgi:hypothetical protein